MLALTQGAADVVEAIVAQPETPDSAVLRIASRTIQENGGPSHELELMVVPEPEDSDILVEGIPIAVERETLTFLDDKVLDAEVEGSDVRFSLYQQPPGAQPNGNGMPD